MLQAGFNVIGVENDEKQYNQLFSEMNSWVAKVEKEREDAQQPLPKPKKAAKSASDAPENGSESDEPPPQAL
jgi:hypothetical protein